MLAHLLARGGESRDPELTAAPTAKRALIGAATPTRADPTDKESRPWPAGLAAWRFWRRPRPLLMVPGDLDIEQL